MGLYQQPARPSQDAYNQPVRPAPAVVVATAQVAQPQKPSKPEIPYKKDVAIPKIADSTFDILDKYNINQLKELLSNDQALEQVAMDVADKALNRNRRKLRLETKADAEKNLSYKE